MNHDKAKSALPHLEELMAIEPSAITRAWFFDDDEEDDFEHTTPAALLAQGVAVVQIDGPLVQRGSWYWDGYEAIFERFSRAALDQRVRAIVLRINSPGGHAAGCFEMVRQMRAVAEEAGKPVLAYADERACSAAYAIACVADEIWLPPSGQVGSVGVIATYYDETRALELEGVRAVVLASGKYKADGSRDVPITEEMIQRLRRPVDQLAAQFGAWVGSRRRLTASAVLSQEAAVWMGEEALSAKLADKVGSLSDCLAAALGRAQANRPPAARASAERGMRMKTVLAALGLSEEAGEADALAAVTNLLSAQKELLGLTGKSSAPEALGALQGLVETSRAHEALVATVRKERETARAAAVEGAYKRAREEGRVTEPSEKAFRAQFPVSTDEDLARLTSLLASLPVVLPAGDVRQRDEGAQVSKPWEQLTSEEKHRLFNDNPKAYQALKADHARRTAGAQSR